MDEQLRGYQIRQQAREEEARRASIQAGEAELEAEQTALSDTVLERAHFYPVINYIIDYYLCNPEDDDDDDDDEYI